MITKNLMSLEEIRDHENNFSHCEEDDWSKLKRLCETARAAHELKAEVGAINTRHTEAIKKSNAEMRNWIMRWAREREENEEIIKDINDHVEITSKLATENENLHKQLRVEADLTLIRDNAIEGLEQIIKDLRAEKC